MATATTLERHILGQGIGQPATKFWLVTPSDTAALRYVTRAIRVGGAGDLAVQDESGEVVTIPSVLAGETLAVVARKIYSTNTTATLIMGLA